MSTLKETELRDKLTQSSVPVCSKLAGTTSVLDDMVGGLVRWRGEKWEEKRYAAREDSVNIGTPYDVFGVSSTTA